MKKNIVIQVLRLSKNGRMEGWRSNLTFPVFPKESCIKGLDANCKKRIAIMFLAICVLLMTESALAHKMMMDALVNDDGTVLLEAFFPDGSPAVNTVIEVFSANGSLFVEGKTNEDGQFIVTPEEKPGTWKAVATGKMGHKTSTEFEIGAGVGEKEPVELAEKEEESISKKEKLAHKEPIPWNQILSGLGFIFGVSAFIISLKLRAELKKLKFNHEVKKRKNAST